MRKRLTGCLVAVFVAFMAAGPARAADDYTIDPVHSGVYFKIQHLGLSNVFGRFNEFSGTFSVDPSDASKCSFAMSIKTTSVDTGNAGRDKHLRSPDFFNDKQFPTIEFKSTAVKPVKDGYEVTGNLTMHGETKPITFTLTGGKKAEMKGVTRTGFTTELVLKRTDFGVGANVPPATLGEEVQIAIGIEGTKK
ncbi:MAG TPA: YceI family protein [Gemmataceae bacterium]|nr:YceI family protein [Gemmataceae bacterium]